MEVTGPGPELYMQAIARPRHAWGSDASNNQTKSFSYFFRIEKTHAHEAISSSYIKRIAASLTPANMPKDCSTPDNEVETTQLPEDRHRKRSKPGKGSSGGQEPSKRPKTRGNPDPEKPTDLDLARFIPCNQQCIFGSDDETDPSPRVGQYLRDKYIRDLEAKREEEKKLIEANALKERIAKEEAENEKRVQEEAAALALKRAEANKLEQAKKAQEEAAKKAKRTQEEAAEKAKRDAKKANEKEEYDARYNTYLADGGDPDDWVDID